MRRFGAKESPGRRAWRREGASRREASVALWVARGLACGFGSRLARPIVDRGFSEQREEGVMRPVAVLACLRRLLYVVGVAFAALPVGSALADVTLGQVGGQSGFSALCSGVLADTNTNPNYVVPPGGGVITSFSIQTGASNNGALGNDGTQVQFLVLRPVGGGNYEGVGSSGLVFLSGTGTQTFPVQDIHAQGGDILGLFVLFSPASDLCVRAASSGGVVVSAPKTPPPGPGRTVALSVPAGVSLDLNESANLRPGESSPPPLTKDQCKNGGWRNASQFKNQGDCISFVASGAKNPPGES